ACGGGGWASLRAARPPSALAPPPVLAFVPTPTTDAPPGAAAAAGGVAPRVLHVSRAPGRDGQVAVASASSADAALLDLRCERVHQAGEVGVCLEAIGPQSYSGFAFDGAHRKTFAFGVPGIPSRARAAPDGARVAWTAFVTGHSYLGAVGFSTETSVVDLRARHVTNLERMELRRNGERWAPVDLNYWGVTFAADSEQFYATVQSGGVAQLVTGDLRAQRLDTLGVIGECPSLSPSGRRLAFKRRVEAEGRTQFRVVVRELDTGAETLLAGAGEVDDQVEWLDEDTLLFGVSSGGLRERRSSRIMAVDTAADAAPALLLADAESPAVLR
ncbi:MAG: hypothetical protein ACKVWR_18880, partial [Acidimicrobiales bacterium]